MATSTDNFAADVINGKRLLNLTEVKRMVTVNEAVNSDRSTISSYCLPVMLY